MTTSVVKCSEFVKRQTPESGFSHYEGSWDELEYLTTAIMYDHPECIRRGYRVGVLLLDVPNHYIGEFYSSIVAVQENTKLLINYAPRQPGEDAFMRISALGKKQKAKHVTIVLYNYSVLEEDKSRSTDAEWEIIAIKARTTDKEEPMDPYTMARNFLHMKGGTKGEFTALQFAESIVYWNNNCMLTGHQSWWNKIKRMVK